MNNNPPKQGNNDESWALKIMRLANFNPVHRPSACIQKEFAGGSRDDPSIVGG